MTLIKKEHPTRENLFEYAEQLDSNQPPLATPITTHLRHCTRCAAEVESMRRSLTVTKLARRSIEPTIALEASTILGMKTQWLAHRRQMRRHLIKSSAAAALFMTIMSASLATSNTPGDNGISKTYRRSGQLPPAVSYDTLTRQSAEERLLEPAIHQSNWQPATHWEQSQRRALEMLDTEINEALAAIQSNPALVRAGTVVNTNRETKRQTLKLLYAQRDL